ncbi:unnamed protein product [Ectocarpus sp. 12 AP-2014]
MGRGKGRAGPKEVALELGRVGFEYDGEEVRDFAAFELQGEDGGVGGGSSSNSSSVVPTRPASSVHRRLGSRGGSGGALLGTASASRREDFGAGSRLNREMSVDEEISPSPPLLQEESSEHDTLLGGQGEENKRDGFGRRQ